MPTFSRTKPEKVGHPRSRQQVEGDPPACRTLAAHGSGGTLIEIPHPPARVGCLSKRDASWLHRGSKITFVLRGYVSSLSPPGQSVNERLPMPYKPGEGEKLAL